MKVVILDIPRIVNWDDVETLLREKEIAVVYGRWIPTRFRAEIRLVPKKLSSCQIGEGKDG